MMLTTSSLFACHTTNITTISNPTPIGGGQYTTTVRACFGQYTAGNWGGTQSFTFTVSGTIFVSFSPATITNIYNAFTGASCSGPNCFMNTCGVVSATATGTLTSSTVVTYNTTSSTPAGYPIVPDDNESCTGCPTSFCFNFTFVTAGYPTSIVLGGNIEMLRPKVCRSVCGFSANYGSACNGSYDASMAITFSAPLPVELIEFKCITENADIQLKWITASETNNSHFGILRADNSLTFNKIGMILGNQTTSEKHYYQFIDLFPELGDNYYMLEQVDNNGDSNKSFMINCFYENKKCVITYYNLLGQLVDIKQANSGMYLRMMINGDHYKIEKYWKL